MASEEHIEILKQGIAYWNKWRDENPDVEPDLSNLHILEVVDITTGLSGINLSNAYMSGCDFFAADLTNANLERAVLEHCNCYSASFDRANLKSANLQLVNFTLASFDETDFEGAYLGNTVFGSCNLSTAKNLNSCNHANASIIDHFTLLMSFNLSYTFLHECGLPDFIINNISALNDEAISFNSCFISYSSKDQEFARRLYSSLQNLGIKCWFAPEALLGGKKIYDQINQAIVLHEKLLIILSEQSLKSSWVATEIKRARTRERLENRKMLFPISLVSFDLIKEWELFDADLGTDLAAEIRSYHIPDFSNWRNLENYNMEIGRLLKSLKRVE